MTTVRMGDIPNVLQLKINPPSKVVCWCGVLPSLSHLLQQADPNARVVCIVEYDFRHPFFLWGEGLEWRCSFLNVYPLSHCVLATKAFFFLPFDKTVLLILACIFFYPPPFFDPPKVGETA